MTTIVEIKRALADRAEDVVPMLLPAGKRAGKEWKVGGTDGGKGDSMSVCLRGDRAGVWSDFATGESGDLIDLWCAVRGVDLVEALSQIKTRLGIRDERVEGPRKDYRRPERPKALKPVDATKQWLLDRGLTEETIAAFKVAVDGQFVLLPYLRDGELINIKRRSVADKKLMTQEKGAEPCLFGWHLIDPQARRVAITEGEFDAMVLHQMGIPALSCNAGAKNHDWVGNDWDRLARFERIDLCYDNDEPGQQGAVELAKRLGLDRCRIVTFPSKDANDFLLAGGTREQFAQAVAAGRALDPDELVCVSAYTDDVIAMFAGQTEVDTAPPLVIGREEDWFRFRQGEMTVYTGYNGHGKSLAVGLIQLGLMEYGRKFCVFSGELHPLSLMRRMARQACGMDNPSMEFLRCAMDWMAERMWVFNVLGGANSARMLDVFRYAARRYGVTDVVIDSLMMLEDVPEDGPKSLEIQRQFMLRAAEFAKQHSVHVHVVAHPRKATDESRAAGKMDVSGSGKITNLADNVISVWAKLRDENLPPDVDDEGREKCDSKIEVQKQRNGEVQHKSVWCWFDKRSLQHCRDERRRPRRYAEAAWEARG